MFCPKCRYEYKQGVKICNDCGSALVEKLPEPAPVLEFETEVLTKVDSEMDAEILIDMLEEEGVECFSRAFTSVFKLSLDKTGAWGDVVVNKEKLEKAKKVLKLFKEEL